MSGNFELRQKIDTAVKLVDPKEFSRRLELLRREYGHSIKIIELARDMLRTFNCYAYALGIWKSDEFQRRAAGNRSEIALVNSSVIQRMLDNNDLEPRNVGAVIPGDMLLYFNESGVKHGAAYLGRDNGRIVVRSKWGPDELFEHEIWEVPASYGDQVKFFKKPTLELCLSRIDEPR